MSQNMDDGIHIFLAQDETDREKIFRLRYEIYVEEMKRRQKYADHDYRHIREPLDESAILAAAQVNDRLVGCVRVNYARNGGLGMYEELYGLKELGKLHPAHTSITTKLMIHPEFRGSSIARELSRAIYLRGLADDVRVNVIDCNDHLLPMYERLGYRKLRDIEHPEYGIVSLLILAMEDLDHLIAARSPFVADLNTFRQVSTAFRENVS